MIDLTKILIALIDLMALFITYKVVPLIKARLTTEQQVQLRAVIRVAVFAAEQLYGAGKGDDKLDFVEKYLAGKGFTVDRAEIEAAVYSEINFLKDGTEAVENPAE